MNCLESFFMHILQQQGVLIEEQRVNDLYSLYDLAHVTKPYTKSHDAHFQLQFTSDKHTRRTKTG